VQQRLSRQQVRQAFDDLLASAGQAADVPTEGREKMSRPTIARALNPPNRRCRGALKCPVVHGSGPQT
jgi:hypothetical protein